MPVFFFALFGTSDHCQNSSAVQYDYRRLVQVGAYLADKSDLLQNLTFLYLSILAYVVCTADRFFTPTL